MDIIFNYWIYIIFIFTSLYRMGSHCFPFWALNTLYRSVWFFCLWHFKAVASMPIENEKKKWKKTKTLIKSINKGPQTADPFTLNATLFFRSIDWCRCLWLELIQLDRGLLWFVRSAYFVLIFFFCILKSGTWKLCVQIILLWHWLM